MRIARALALALLPGCAAAPAREPGPVVLFSVQPAGVVRSDAWSGVCAPQEQVRFALELARVRITEVDASEHELTAMLSTLVVRQSGEVLLGERSVAQRAERVLVEELDARGAASSGYRHGSAEKAGEVVQNVMLGIGALATFGMLTAFSDCGPVLESPPDP